MLNKSNTNSRNKGAEEKLTTHLSSHAAIQ